MSARRKKSSILETDLSNYPDTLNDVEVRESEDRKPKKVLGDRITNLLDQIRIVPKGFRNSGFLSNLSSNIQLHSALPKYGSLSAPLYDIYLVKLPKIDRYFSRQHWSLYTQGKFFHVVLQENNLILRIDPSPVTDKLKQELECQNDNVHHLDTLSDRSRHIKPLIAYGIGQTQFHVTQIERIAQLIHHSMEKYTMSYKNCQFFVLWLATRTVMTNGIGIIFVGTKPQIVQWDNMAKHHDLFRPFSQEEGYLLRAPNHDLSTIPWWKLLKNVSNAKFDTRAAAILQLYLHGPMSLGSFDPTGRHESVLAYGLSKESHSLRRCGRQIKEGLEWIFEHIARGEISLALQGDHESNLRYYESIVIEAGNGQGGSRFLEPFHRTLLGISEAEKHKICIRVQNREAGHEGATRNHSFHHQAAYNSNHSESVAMYFKGNSWGRAKGPFKNFTPPKPVSYSEYASAREVQDVPIGFDPQDRVYASETPQNKIEAFLAPNDGNNEKEYQIGIAFMGAEEGSLRLGHAAVVLHVQQEYDLHDTTPSPPFTSNPNTARDVELRRGGDVKVLHIRFVSPDNKNKLVLALDESTTLGNPEQPLMLYRYVDLYRIRTTERVLKHIALRFCPAQHRALVADCATFTYNFLTELLGYLENRGSITEDELENHRKALVRVIHIEDGIQGESEAASRQDPYLAITGQMAVRSAGV